MPGPSRREACSPPAGLGPNPVPAAEPALPDVMPRSGLCRNSSLGALKTWYALASSNNASAASRNRPRSRVNAGEKMHQRAGVKLHQDGMPKAPTGGLLVGDKQDEKPNCLQLAGYKLLIIDELGYVPLSTTGAELLFEVFSQRYERGSTIVTSNLPFDEWTGVFGSERLTGALLDRLTHHVHILEMNGDSYRLKQSKRRQRQPQA